MTVPRMENFVKDTNNDRLQEKMCDERQLYFPTNDN